MKDPSKCCLQEIAFIYKNTESSKKSNRNSKEGKAWMSMLISNEVDLKRKVLLSKTKRVFYNDKWQFIKKTSTACSLNDRKSRQKFSKAIEDIDITENLVDIYRTLWTKKC